MKFIKKKIISFFLINFIAWVKRYIINILTLSRLIFIENEKNIFNYKFIFNFNSLIFRSLAFFKNSK